MFSGVRQIQHRSASWEGVRSILLSEVLSFSAYKNVWLLNLLLPSDPRQLLLNYLHFASDFILLKETKTAFQNILCRRVIFYSESKFAAIDKPRFLDFLRRLPCSLWDSFPSHSCPSLSLASRICYFCRSFWPFGLTIYRQVFKLQAYKTMSNFQQDVTKKVRRGVKEDNWSIEVRKKPFKFLFSILFLLY